MRRYKFKLAENPAITELVFSVILRYSLLLLFVLTNIFSFFIPIATLKAVFYILMIFSEPSLFNSTINFNGYFFELAPACIALSAYYLLLILNFSTPMSFRKRVYSLLFSFSLLFAINIARIVILLLIFTASENLFYRIHFITWFFLSSLVVFLIWIFTIRIFKIKEIPVYSDIKFLAKATKPLNRH